MVNNLSNGIHRSNCETYKIKYRYCDCFLEYKNFKDNLTEYKCLCCDKSDQYKFDKELRDRFFNTFTFSNHDNHFVLANRCLSLLIYG